MVAGAAFGFSLPFMVLRIKRTRRLRAFEEEFPEALDLISRALKAGHAFATGLKMVADEMKEPVGPEFRKTFDEQNFGLPLKDALENLTLRIPILDMRFFATAVLIQRETGGNLSEILENLAHVVRERFKILRQVRVYTAHGRLTGYVLLALPAVLAIALSFINPEHMNMLFRERIGQMLLMVAIVHADRRVSSGSGKSSRSRCSVSMLLPLLAFVFGSLLIAAVAPRDDAEQGGGDRSPARGADARPRTGCRREAAVPGARRPCSSASARRCRDLRRKWDRCGCVWSRRDIGAKKR